MKNEIVSLLKTKSTLETVDLTSYLKAVVGTGYQSREKMRDLKALLTKMVEAGEIVIPGNTHLHLDDVDPTPVYNDDGMGAPTQYRNLDTLSIHAYGTSDSAPASAKATETKKLSPAELEAAKSKFFSP